MRRYVQSRGAVAIVTIGAVACASAAAVVWNGTIPGTAATASDTLSPLAVIDSAATDTAHAVAGSGIVRIGERCVTLVDSTGSESTLAWRSAEVRWDGSERAVVFSARSERDQARVWRITDNDPITVGGTDVSVLNGPEARDARVRRRAIPWATPPDASCPEGVIIVEAILPGGPLTPEDF